MQGYAINCLVYKILVLHSSPLIVYSLNFSIGNVTKFSPVLINKFPTKREKRKEKGSP